MAEKERERVGGKEAAGWTPQKAASILKTNGSPWRKTGKAPVGA